VVDWLCNDDPDRPDRIFTFHPPSRFMSVRLYIGNLPQDFDSKALESQLANVGEGIRFKAVLDRETGTCRGFGFANVNDENVADAVIEHFNGKDFGGSALRVERSERRDSNGGTGTRRGGGRDQGHPPGSARKAMNKVVHSDAKVEEAPDPRWAGELSKLKDLLANQKAAV
jgi:RNA recognition motif-containing protein